IGTGTSVTLWIFRSFPGLPLWHHYNNSTTGAFWSAVWAFCAGAGATIVVSLFTEKKKDEELVGLVYQLTPKPEQDHSLPWWKKPLVLGAAALVLTLIINLIFW
ncbi:sodium:solute symporter, partial [mine drainage metagenome]